MFNRPERQCYLGPSALDRIRWRPRRDGKYIHITDVTNASRYLLMNIKTLEWDDEMLDLFGIKKEWLPRIVSSAERVTGIEPSGVQKLHVTGILGDQHASSLGHRLREGDSKNTYGTGCFAMRNTGKTITRSKRRYFNHRGVGN